MALFAIGFAASDEDENSNSSSSTEQVTTENEENTESKKKEEIQHDFFERGYEYSASYRVDRKQGYGLSANYSYKIKIYNDGTTEIVEEIIGDEFPGHPSELYKCSINKKSESYRDVAATWYEVEFHNGRLNVDNLGNIILLHENGNNKTIVSIR